MSLWVMYQETDFCKNPWEERVFNAVVGMIYCFCFFNLKESQSRYRASLFYLVIVAENFVFIWVFNEFASMEDPYLHSVLGFCGYIFVTAGKILHILCLGFHEYLGSMNLCSCS